MTTVKYAEISPYKKEKRNAHHTDFKYMKFLKDAGIAEDSSDSAIVSKPLNVALFGLGRAGSIHFVNIVSNAKFRLVYVVEADLEKSRRVQREYGLSDSAILSNSQEDVVFNDPSIDGIIVATPTFTHAALVTKGLKSGKAVLCEKPISQDEEGTKMCYRVAKEVGKPLLCAFNRRFEPSFTEVYNQVQQGNVGQVHLIKTIARDSPLPSLDYLKISGGIFHDCGVHDIDLICWIMGEYPVKAFATATAFIPEIKEIGDYDTVAMTLIFPSGAIGMTDLSRNSVYGYDQRLEVFGPKGMVCSANEGPMRVTLSGVSGQSEPPIYHSFPSRYQEGYKIELQHFYDVIQGKASAMVTGENTLKVSKIASALEESAKAGKLVTIRY